MRYQRQIILPHFGQDGQKRLRESSVLVIGAGGLGVPVLQYLVAAGIGKIGIVDHDSVDLSNLQRQVIYTEQEIGQSKAALAHKKMQALNSEIRIEAFHTELTAINVKAMIRPYDVVVDCTDNFPTRYLVNDACYFEKKILVYGAIYRWEGQVSVFNFEESANYRDLFPNPPLPGEVPNCAEGGVIGVLPGIIGCMMANECIKIVSGIGEILKNKLLLYDTLTGINQIIKYKKRIDNPISGDNPTVTDLIDYAAFCGIKTLNASEQDVISASELNRWLKNKTEFQLIDVREIEEFEYFNIGGNNIPLSRIKTETHQIDEDSPAVLVCETGKRSMSVLQFLKKEHDFDNLLSLEGGLKSFAEQNFT